MRVVVVLLAFVLSSCAARELETLSGAPPSKRVGTIVLLVPSSVPPAEPPLSYFLEKSSAKKGSQRDFVEQQSNARARRVANLAEILRNRRSVSYKRDGRLVVGLLLPQTRFPALAKSMENAARLALREEEGFSRVKLLVRDSGTKPGRAQRSAAELLAARADILIGPVFAAQSLPVAAAADRARKPLLTFSNDDKVQGKFVYRFGLSVREQTAVALADGLQRPPQAFYKEKNKRHRSEKATWGTRVAVLAPRNSYGRLVVQESNAYIMSRRLAPQRVDFFDNALDYDTLDGQIRHIADFDYRKLALLKYRKQRRRARAQLPVYSSSAQEINEELKILDKLDTYGPPPFDILLLPETRREALQVVSSYLALYDIDAYQVGIYGLAPWGAMRNLWQEPQLRGCRFVFLSRTTMEQFTKRFHDYTNSTAAVHTLTALAYDAVLTASKLGAQKGYVSREDLEPEKGFSAVAGRFRFRADGEVQRIYEIREITRRGDKTLPSSQRNFLP